MTTRNPNGPDWAMSPTQWGAAVDYDQWTHTVYEKDSIAIHHGGGGNYAAHQFPYSVSKETAQLRAWEAYHLRKGWEGIGYGWAVGFTGTVYRLRGWNNYAAHTGDVDADGISNNKEIAPVLFIMSGSVLAPGPALIRGFESLRAYLELTEGRPLPLFGHKEVQGGTACPGPFNMVYVEANRDSGDDMGLSAEMIELLTRPDAEAEMKLMLDSAKEMAQARGVDGSVQPASGSSLKHLLENDRYQADGAGYKVTDEGAQRTWFAKVTAHLKAPVADPGEHTHTAKTTIT